MRRPFTKEEIDFLKDNYEAYMREMRFDELADKLGRNKSAVCKKAMKLGLTNNSRKYLRKWYNNN